MDVQQQLQCLSMGVYVISNIFKSIFIESEDSGSSSDEEEEAIIVNLQRLQNRIGLNGEVPVRNRNYLENIIPLFNDKTFQSHFRISRATFEALVNGLSPTLKKLDGVRGKNRICVEKQLLATVWLLATPESYRSVADRFDLGKSSLFTCFHRVITSLNGIAPDIIKWPGIAERVTIKNTFFRMAGLNGVLGAIDGTYVPIKAPQENPEVYINRKCFHAITLQGICVPSLKFIDCFAGYPSSVSDIRVLRNSDVYAEFCNNTADYFNADEYIIGDKAYPVYNWCIPPYIDRRQLQPHHVRFNTVHAKTRQVIERAFALLFGRFRRLRYLDMNRVDLIPVTIIIAACVLHNICLSHPDELINVYVNEALPLMMHNNEDGEDFGNRGERVVMQAQGFHRRDELARQL